MGTSYFSLQLLAFTQVMTQQFPTLSNYENASSWRRSLKDYFKEHNLLYIIDEKSKLCLDQPTLEDVVSSSLLFEFSILHFQMQIGQILKIEKVNQAIFFTLMVVQ